MKKENKTFTSALSVKLIILNFALAIFFLATPAQADRTAPHTIDYQGVILDDNSKPVTDKLNFRFSLWKNSDYISSDLTATGSINTSNVNFTNYSETQEVTPDKNGNIYAIIGDLNPLPDLNPSIHKYMQVEIKKTTESDTAYKILDVDKTKDSVDRSFLSSAAYAINSDLIDNLDVGYGPGQIANLNANSKFDSSAIPNSLTETGFTINSGNIDIDSILNFGDDGVLKWDAIKNYFNFDKSVYINGNLTATGSATVDGNLQVNGNINGLSNPIHTQNTDTGSTANTFILNTDDTGGDVKLQFGETLAKIFKWAVGLARFELGDSLYIYGNLDSQNNTNVGQDLNVEGNTDIKGNLVVTGSTILNNNLTISGTVNNRNISTDGTKLDTVETGATADQNSQEVPFTSTGFTATNVRDAIAELKKTVNTATFIWDFLPDTDGQVQDFYKKNKGTVMTHSGSITTISLSTNPADANAAGNYVITKNDGADYDSSEEMTRISQSQAGTGDAKNSLYIKSPVATPGGSGLEFNAGDIIRAYIEGDAYDDGSRLTLEVNYFY